MPARRKEEPIRSSRPMPRATSPTSAPTSSQTLAISLMKEILVARKALEASLIISALETSVWRISPQRLVEVGDRRGRLLVAGVGADHDPVGVHEVGHRRALLEELGAGDVGEPGQVAADRFAGPGRDRALHDQHVVAVVGQLLDHGADTREVGVAGVGRRRVDADEEQAGGVEQLAHVGGEGEALGVAA